MITSVPWNAGWSGEEQFEIRPCRWAKGELAVWQKHDPCSGKPIFAKPHFVRQRRSVAQFLCTVCGQHTPQDDRWWFQHGSFREGYFMTTESPVHKACGQYSSNVCPHLRLRHTKVFEPFPMSGVQVLAALLNSDGLKSIGLQPTDKHIIGALKFAWHESDIRMVKS